MQGGIGGLLAGYADKEEKDQQQHNVGIYAQAAAERDPAKVAELLKGLKGGDSQQTALFGQIIQNNINEGLKQQQAGATLATGGYGIGQGTAPGNGTGNGLVIDINRRQPPGTIPTGPTNLDNNVMNIRQSGAPWEGKGTPQNGFETFNTPQAGANATAQNFAAYVKENPNITVAQAIAKWAPPNENNTNAYISQVAETTGINPGQPLAQVMQNPVEFARLMEAGTAKEKGAIPAGVTPDVLVNAGQRVAGAQPPQPAPPGVQVAQAGPAQPQMPTTSPGGDMLRAQAQQAFNSGNKTVALQLAQEAQKADVAYMDKAGLQFQQQGLQQPNQTISNEGKLRDDFRGEPVVKAYREVVPIMESVRDALKRPTRAADLNLIYGLGKMMDPTSVVREGEMVMARGTGTVQDYINGLLGQLNGNPTLLPETRQKIVDEMQSRFQGLQQSHDTVAEVYKGIAQRSGLNHENVVIPIRQGKPAQQEAAPAKAGPQRIDLNGNPL